MNRNSSYSKNKMAAHKISNDFLFIKHIGLRPLCLEDVWIYTLQGGVGKAAHGIHFFTFHMPRSYWVATKCWAFTTNYKAAAALKCENGD